MATAFDVTLADTPELKELVYRFRYDIYVKTMGRRQIYANHDCETIEEPLDRLGRNYIAHVENQIIGTIRGNTLDDPAAAYYRKLYKAHMITTAKPHEIQLTTKLMMLPELQRSIYSLRLIQRYAAVGWSNGIKVDLIDCNKHLRTFFERLGYFSYIGWVFHKEFGTVRPMVLAVDIADYLRSIKSVLAPIAAKYTTDNQYDGYALIRGLQGDVQTENLKKLAQAHIYAAETHDRNHLRDDFGFDGNHRNGDHEQARFARLLDEPQTA